MPYRVGQSGPRISDWSHEARGPGLAGFRLNQHPALGWLLFLAAYVFISLVVVLGPMR